MLVNNEKPNWNPSLIDNMFVNSSGNLLNSEIIENKISHHLPIFCFMNCFLPHDVDDKIKFPKYVSQKSIVSYYKLITRFSLYQFGSDSYLQFVDTVKNEIDKRKDS